MAAILSGLDVKCVAFDRWRIDLLKKELGKIGCDLPLIPWGQGFKDMSVALDSLEGELLNARLNHGGHPVLAMCAANAIVVKDPAGGRKLDKGRATGRIDGLQAMAQPHQQHTIALSHQLALQHMAGPALPGKALALTHT
jgi:phage terminase large subunit-like protein